MVKLTIPSPKAFDLPGIPSESQTVYRRDPKTGKLSVCRLKLFSIDGLSRQVLSNGKVWFCQAVSEDERKQYLICKGNTLKPLPRNVFK